MSHAGRALTLLPFGGVYLTGGVARALARWLAGPDVAAAFRDKGRFSDFMAAFGMAIINDDFAALTGCAAHLEILGRHSPSSTPFVRCCQCSAQRSSLLGTLCGGSGICRMNCERFLVSAVVLIRIVTIVSPGVV
jgi:hypothetical protein